MSPAHVFGGKSELLGGGRPLAFQMRVLPWCSWMCAWVAKLWVREFSTGTTLKQELLHRHRRGTRTRLRQAGVAAALRTMRNVDPNRTRPALTDHLARPLLLGVRDGRAPGSRATRSATACRKTFARRGGSDWLPAPASNRGACWNEKCGHTLLCHRRTGWLHWSQVRCWRPKLGRRLLTRPVWTGQIAKENRPIGTDGKTFGREPWRPLGGGDPQ